MEGMNSRVKNLRKNILKMSMEAFGDKIGLSKAAISSFEAGKNGMSDMAVLAICREYDVNEEWLRDGTGEIFREPDEFSLDEVLSNAEISKAEARIIKAYFQLPKETREKILEWLRNAVRDSAADDAQNEQLPVQNEQVTEQSLHADLQREIDSQKKAEGGSTGSGSIAM